MTITATIAVSVTTRAAAQAAKHETQHLLLVEIQRVEEIADGGHQRRAGRPQRLDLAVEEVLRLLAPEVVRLDQPGDLRTARQRPDGAPRGAELLEQPLQQFGLLVAQVQKGTGPGLQPLAAAAVGIGSQAPAEAAPPMTAVVAVATASAMPSVPVAETTPPGREAAETGEAEPGSVDGQRAVEAIVTHRADRTEATIVAEVSVVTFMGMTPASKQVHGAIPR